MQPIATLNITIYKLILFKKCTRGAVMSSRNTWAAQKTHRNDLGQAEATAVTVKFACRGEAL